MKKNIIIMFMAMTVVSAIFAKRCIMLASNLFTNEATCVLSPNSLPAEETEEADPIAAAIVKQSDVNLTFTNDETYPWTIEDGYVQSSNSGKSYSTSKFSTTFTITKPTKFSFKSYTYYYNGSTGSNTNSSYHYFTFSINGARYMGRNSGEGTTSLLLEPGEYTMEWRDSISSNSGNLKSRVSDIELTSPEWIDIEVSTPGSLGVEVLYKVNILNDVELLKVKGALNTTDWTSIKQMNNLIALDLSEAQFDALPDNVFSELACLTWVKLPEGLKTIGAYAFQNRNIYTIDIPSTVTTIGERAFEATKIAKVNFNEDSQLTTIGRGAFYNCSSLKEAILPNSVTSISYGAFQGCTQLKTIIFPDALTTINDYMCYGCSSLDSLHLPANLQTIRYRSFYNTQKLHKVKIPSTVDKIYNEAFYKCGVDSVLLPVTLSYLHEDAFSYCANLKYIELPSHLETGYESLNIWSATNNSSYSLYYGYRDNFIYCPAIETVVCRSATPPVITSDPFGSSRAKSEITLVAPSFAVVNYKLDTYWYQFGSIVEGDDVDYWRITSALSLTNNRRMDGEPSIDLYFGGKLRVGGNAPMPTVRFDYYVSEDNPGMLINDCPDMTTDSLCTKFSVDANKWYFLSPLHDVSLADVSHSAGASYVFRYYDGESRGTNGAGNSWRNVDTGKLLAGQGYIFQCNKAGTISMPSDFAGHSKVFNTGDVTTSLSAFESTAAANKSWNYVGNPYPAYYDVYYMDFTAPITVWNGSTYKAYSIVDDDVVLRPMQSFFVQKPDEVDNIVFHKEGRQFTSSVERASYAKAYAGKNGCSRYLFNLQISNDENATDETRVVINDKAQMSYEITTDASKFLSIVNGVPQLFTIDNDGNMYAINERPLNEGTVQIGFYAPKAGFYTIKAMRADGGVILYDTVLGKNVDISSGDYVFYSEAGNDTSRLVLKFDAGLTEPTAISNVITEEPTVSLTSGSIVVKGGEGTRVEVYTIGGNMVYECVLGGTTKIIKMPAGTYIVKAGDHSYKTIISH